jgi:simple sugar transport system permease protein
MSEQAVGPAPPAGETVSVVDDRLGQVGLTTKLLRRPELGALLGALAVGLFFAAAAASFRTLSGMGQLDRRGLHARDHGRGRALLMIGGEFDLSAGAMTGTTGLLLGLLTTEWGLSMWPAIVATFAFAVCVGLFNGYMVMKTKLPSFIVTLATFFILQGVNLGFTKAITGTVRVAGLTDVAGFQSAATVFSSTFWEPHNFRISVLWWIGITILATWVLARTRFGNWIFAVGGEANAARNVGVPVQRVKVSLFVITSSAAALVGIMIALRLGSVQAGQGIGEEFTYIIAAVVGGCLLTGGYGSAIGAALGALIVGMAFIGIQFSGWNTDWRFLFLGVILLLAVLVNNLVRKSAEGARK